MYRAINEKGSVVHENKNGGKKGEMEVMITLNLYMGKEEEMGKCLYN